MVVTDTQDDGPTRLRILEAAQHCYIQLGVERAGMNDVARVAQVSRGTVYRYFESKQALREASLEHGKALFFVGAADAVARHSSLKGKAGAFAELVAEVLVSTQAPSLLTQADQSFLRLVFGDAQSVLTSTVEFFTPLVVAARAAGEIRARIDVGEAAEWISRLMISILTTPSSPYFDITDPPSVRRFVQRYVVAGLA